MLKFLLVFILAVASVSCTHHEEPDCESPLETGPCKAAFRRFGFDAELGYCRQFTYGGCAGNGNNYKSLKECQEKCEDYCD